MTTGEHVLPPALPTAGTPAAPLTLDHTYRLVTRSDFDGLVCAACSRNCASSTTSCSSIPRTCRTAGCGSPPTTSRRTFPTAARSRSPWTTTRPSSCGSPAPPPTRVIAAEADSAARVVYDHFGGAERFPGVSVEMMEAVDRADAARLSMDDILDPQGWILLSFLMDPRTGLGRFRDFRISNYELMMQLIDCCLTMSIEEILESPDVAERTALYDEHADTAVEQIRRCATVHDRVVVLDLRHEEIIHPTNRFLLYALHPECRISIQVLWGLQQQNTVFALGRSAARSSTVRRHSTSAR